MSAGICATFRPPGRTSSSCTVLIVNSSYRLALLSVSLKPYRAPMAMGNERRIGCDVGVATEGREIDAAVRIQRRDPGDWARRHSPGQKLVAQFGGDVGGVEIDHRLNPRRAVTARGRPKCPWRKALPTATRRGASPCSTDQRVMVSSSRPVRPRRRKARHPGRERPCARFRSSPIHGRRHVQEADFRPFPRARCPWPGGTPCTGWSRATDAAHARPSQADHVHHGEQLRLAVVGFLGGSEVRPQPADIGRAARER